MTINFTGKTVLVTGGAGGIGSAICKVFAEANANVAIHYHNNNNGAEHTLTSLKRNAHSMHQADLSDPDAVNKIGRASCRERV